MTSRTPLRISVALGVVCALLSCNEGDEQKKPFVTKERNQAIAAESVPAPDTSVAPTPSPKPAASKARRKALCEGQLERPGRELAKDTLDRLQAEAGAELPEKIPIGKGRWTWLNFWAAWCVPCREEIPRLRSWETKLNAGGNEFRLVFISLDDDERQLRGFLDKQPRDGLTASYWIKEGSQREEWFQAIDMDPDPQLPVHILVDPKGLVRCVVDGAVEDADFPQVSKIVSG